MCVLVQRALAGDGSAANLQRQRAVIVEKWNSEIKAHFAVEEAVLFPLMAGFPAATSVVGELIAEHAVIRELIGELEMSPSSGVIERFCAVLAEHIRKEERVLFEQAQQLLTREQLDALGARLGTTSS
jgi:hemerythrin-like domain-containing protein